MKRSDSRSKRSFPVDQLSWNGCGALLGLCGGIVTAMLGSLLTATTWIVGNDWGGFHLQTDATVLLFLTIPLLTLGAHCLDLLERKQPRSDGEC